MTYRPELDGLRAIAVLAVILFHAHVPGFSGGFVGVDVFFVISGFLITRIIDTELASGKFSFARFYERRLRRIVPALIGDYSAVNMVCGPTLAAKESSATFCNVPCRTLKSILDEHLPHGQKIDLLSIDCEGVELEILESNDWSRYVPSVICVEDFEWCESGSSSSQISNFLLARGYQAFGWAGASVLWEHESFRKRVIT